MRIFFSVGEPSGDLHAANLIREIRRRRGDVQFVGYGGPQMAEAGCELDEDLTRWAVMGFLRVLLNLHQFLPLILQADRYFRRRRPDAVVLVDYPGFNWWIARRAKARGIPVFYYGLPQLWGWAPWRVRKMRRYVDHALCKLPFEESWYRERGCHAVYVGHPYFDETRRRRLDPRFLDQYARRPEPLVAILPGSRTQEVASNLPTFLKAASIIRRQAPHVRFAIAAFNEKQASLARELSKRSEMQPDVVVGKTPELIELAHCCLACSGSVCLELLYHLKPTVILYSISRTAYIVQRFFRTVKYITLVNLLAADDLFPRDLTPYDPDQPGAEKVPYPEYLTWEDKSQQIARHITEWLTEEPAREARVSQLRELKSAFCAGGASNRAAEYILASLEGEGGLSHARAA